METPKKICLIDTGDGLVWCDSVPSDDIEDSDVVWYTRTPPATDKLIAAAIAYIKATGSSEDNESCRFEDLEDEVAAYQKE